MIKIVISLTIKKLQEKENKTFLTILSLALLFSLVIFSYFTSLSITKHFENQIIFPETNKIYLINSTASSLSSSYLIFEEKKIENRIIREILPVLNLEGYLIINNTEKRIKVIATTPEYLKTLNLNPKILNNENVIAGNLISKFFKIKENNEINLKINNIIYNFKVKKIVNFQNYLDFSLIININEIWKKDEKLKNKINYYEIYLNLKEEDQEIEKIIYSNFKDAKIIYPSFNSIFKKILYSPQTAINFWSYLLFISSFLLGLTITISNSKKIRKDIGILLALGLKKQQKILFLLILSLFTALISLIFGLSIGIILTTVLLKTISGIVNLNISISLDITFIIITSLIFSLSYIIGFIVGSIFSTRKSLSELLR